jgi:hypothetical protein
MNTLEIQDRLSLQDLIANYAWALDTGDTEAMVKCFIPDAVVTEEVFEDPDIWEGHDGIRAFADHYFGAPGFAGRQHHVTQTQYTSCSEHRVTMRSFAFVTECEGEPPYLLRFVGWYDDEAVKTVSGEWLFKRRTIRLWDGEVLKNFPGHGQWQPRKRPDSLKRRDK